MTAERGKDDLWRELRALNESGDVKAALMLVSETALRDDPGAQRYAEWNHFQKGDFVKASLCYVEAARQRSHEAIDECYACARQLDASGMHIELVHLCESHPLATMEKFQRLMRSHYHRTGDAAQLLAWSVLVADHGAIDDLLYVADLYLSAGDPDGAMRFAEAAAAQGSGKANQILGEIYWQGIGVKSDKALASIYYEKAARSGLCESNAPPASGPFEAWHVVHPYVYSSTDLARCQSYGPDDEGCERSTACTLAVVWEVSPQARLNFMCKTGAFPPGRS